MVSRKVLKINCKTGKQEYRNCTQAENDKFDDPRRQAWLAARVKRQKDRETVRARVRKKTELIEGLEVDDLTIAQMQLLVMELLSRSGAINPDLTLKPVTDWG